MGGVVIAAGGTGGHLYPALAVARELGALIPQAPVTFMGNGGGPEATIVPGAGYAFVPIASGPWRRGRVTSLLRGGALSLKGAWEARRALRRTGASVVFSTGGYASAPVLLAAAACGIPYVLHEPNRRPGLVNRMFAPMAAIVTVGDEAAAAAFAGRRCLVTGVPVRQELGSADRGAARAELKVPPDRVVVLALGGSQGAASINRLMTEAIPFLAGAGVPLAVAWVTGKAAHEEAARSARAAGIPVRTFAYREDIASLYAASDFVVSRAGASTVAELRAVGRPSLLVPYPHAASDHQRENARALERDGAAVMLEEGALDGERLAGEIAALAADPVRRDEMGRRAKAGGRPLAARLVADAVRGTGEAEAARA